MLGQSKTTSLFFSVQRPKAGTLSFPLHPYTFAVQKERLYDGVKGTEKGSRMTKERQGKGWIKKNNETNKHIQPGIVKVYSSLKYHPDNLDKRKQRLKKRLDNNRKWRKGDLEEIINLL